MMSVSVNQATPISFGPPSVLFEAQAHDPVAVQESLSYDVSPDVRQFLITSELPQPHVGSVDFVLNWWALLK